MQSKSEILGMILMPVYEKMQLVDKYFKPQIMSPIKFDITPEISVVLCTYNRANYLNRAIDSVIEQIFKNWELLIVDDGSQDNTFEIVNTYLQQFRNIRYLKHQNRKLGYAKNVGIQASFGKYITFIDSDDTYKQNHLESRLNYMQSHPEIDLIEGGFFSEEEIFVADYFQPGQIINLRECVLGPTFFGKRRVFFELQGFNNIAYGEDTDFWERAEKIFQTQKIAEPQTYVYTRAETSITKDILEQRSST
jgi:glycosyltransferase involved in cell wall biosynthesis